MVPISCIAPPLKDVLGVANDKLPAPSVFINWFAPPSLVGYVSPLSIQGPSFLNVAVVLSL